MRQARAPCRQNLGSSLAGSLFQVAGSKAQDQLASHHKHAYQLTCGVSSAPIETSQDGEPNCLLDRLRCVAITPPSAPSNRCNCAILVTLTLPSTGLLTRMWQMGIEMRPLFNKSSLWAYPVYGVVGGSFGYWMQGLDERQTALLEARKQAILDKRARRAERAAALKSATQPAGTPSTA